MAAIPCRIAMARLGDLSSPNIILIFGDDVGLGDIHCTGGPVHTPNIDKLASEGTKFKNCYGTPMCGPSRAELLTGRYPFRTGLNGNYAREALDPRREVMIPTVLKKACYVTASVGKWGQIQLAPGEWGFDEFLVFPGSGCYWREQTKYYIVSGKPGETTQFDYVLATHPIGMYRVKGTRRELAEDQYLPDLMSQYAASFIAHHKDHPFFLYYPMSHIHRPIVRTPNTQAGTERDLYGPNVEYMDKLVGDLVKELDRQNLRRKTLVIFVGDNGTDKLFADLATVNGRQISGWKNSMLEGGSRVPLLVNWPGTTPAGKINDNLIDLSDFFVTLAELAGAELPHAVTFDGKSFAPQIRGEKGSPRDWIYVELDGKSYVRDARYKLTNDGRMFDLTDAPFKELPVARDTSAPPAIAARQKLQAVLDTHPAAPRRRTDLEALKKSAR